MIESHVVYKMFQGPRFLAGTPRRWVRDWKKAIWIDDMSEAIDLALELDGKVAPVLIGVNMAKKCKKTKKDVKVKRMPRSPSPKKKKKKRSR